MKKTKLGKFVYSDRKPKAGEMMVCINRRSVNYKTCSVANETLIKAEALDYINWKVIENMEDLKQELVDAVIESLKKDIANGDLTVLDELLHFIPNKNLVQSLDEKQWKLYPEFNNVD